MSNGTNDKVAANAKRLLWAGFTAILAAGVGFAIRSGILDVWKAKFGFTGLETGLINGAGFTGFCFGIIIGGIICDKIGYGKLVIAAFGFHVTQIAEQPGHRGVPIRDPMNFGIIQFPGSNCDQDAYHALADVLGQPTRYIWHKDRTLGDVDCVVVPGGFSYGDYLRTGAIARFSPAMKAVAAHAQAGGLVIGICNGFQILCEAHLLPGALIRNRGLKFICDHVHVRVETTDSPFTNACRKGQVLRIPIAHGEGNYFAEPAVLEQLKRDDRILVRYCDKAGNLTDAANVNGSLDYIAGICNEGRNVFGLMPHPERASEAILGSEDGRVIFESILRAAVPA